MTELVHSLFSGDRLLHMSVQVILYLLYNVQHCTRLAVQCIVQFNMQLVEDALFCNYMRACVSCRVLVAILMMSSATLGRERVMFTTKFLLQLVSDTKLHLYVSYLVYNFNFDSHSSIIVERERLITCFYVVVYC